MTTPGRTTSGRFARDDTTVKQVLGSVIAALRLIQVWMANPTMDARSREATGKAMADALNEAEDALAQLDVGTRPTREPEPEPDIRRVTRFSTTKEPS